MAVWFTSDTHGGHENIIRYCGRPFRTVSGMNREMRERWNARVAPRDTIYHLGDFAFGSLGHASKEATWAKYVKKLRGRKILVRGNHDRNADVMRAIGFDDVLENAIVDVGGVRVWVNHYPTHSHDARDMKRPKAPGPYDIALCGHVHQAWRVNEGVVNVGVDVWNFHPVSLADAIAAREVAS